MGTSSHEGSIHDGGEENYKWLGKMPRMREWVGDREIQNLQASDYTIKNKDYELTVGVDRNDIEDDTIGLYNPIVQDMGQSAAAHPDELVFGLLLKGFKEKCYDKQPFFSDKHKIGEKVFSNKGTKKLSVRSYAAARSAMMSLVDDGGKSLKLVPNLLVVSPANEEMGRKILYADQIDGTTNTFKSTAELLVVPDLAESPDAWFLLCTTKPLKPLIYQERKAARFVAMDRDTDENVFMRKQFLYGVDGRSNAGYGFWQMAYGSTGEEDEVNPEPPKEELSQD
ncbi:Mu-like prophage major head subunit gpT family protein [Paenibacillus melissococcoides]|uniref:Mu-like prophage major head subunit gpT family protein n=1 Tax=Paenibacillus melissococcoides TaxID=2912268 RepID=A0ABM9GBY4_9BACL|nr:Mu-like prophage major head subunit gpT family protein [Paenibacillus melissococcoides]CAH8249002.1 Mu-like prophage major head subunit gpT family protein [Paenibacillus melissococcoides]CAH8249194.1 Mu-like prophage major head subunit gpT family protein [Paenibacillus melissococcoides]CAH8249587.1 Mu-like prophage major head subunit gpT family protein [Paenibacillus melissococcoides]